jgi:ABC-type transport system involved in multi-copper enzyme maturation permease subunit
MLSLIRKDLIMNKMALLANLVIMVGALAFMASLEEGAPPGLFAFFTGLMMAFIPAMIVTREDKYQAMALGCSLPVTREAIVRSRYVLAVCTAGFGILLAFLVGSFLPSTRLGPELLFRPPVVLQAVSIMVLLVSLLLPFTLRFGAMGLILVLVGFQGLGIVALTAGKVAGSVADRRLIEGIVGAVRDIHAWAGPEGFYALVPAFLFLILVLSYGLSVWVFKRREL